MSTKTRIYAVHDAGLNKCHLVRASNASSAVRHVARAQYTPEVATQERLVEALGAGEVVQVAGESPLNDDFAELVEAEPLTTGEVEA